MSSNGTLFVGDIGTNAVYGYAPPYTGAPFAITSGVDEPLSLAFDATGDLFIANSLALSGANFSVVAPPYTGAAVLLYGTVGARQVVATSGGVAFGLDSSLPTVTEFAPPYGSGTTYFDDVSQVGSVAVGPDGTTLFVAQNGVSRIGLFAPPYSVLSSQTSGSSANQSKSLAFNAAAELFSANQGNNTVTIYVPPYTRVPYTVSSGISTPSAVFLSP